MLICGPDFKPFECGTHLIWEEYDVIHWPWESSSREPAVRSIIDGQLPTAALLATIWVSCQGHTYPKLLSAMIMNEGVVRIRPLLEKAGFL